jgi:DNA-binding MarR family transcriptional regulator
METIKIKTKRDEHKEKIMKLLEREKMSIREIAECLGLRKTPYITSMVEELAREKQIEKKILQTGKRHTFIYSLPQKSQLT